jgi:glycogen operon protein
MLATLFLSQGAPMLLAGDEFGNSQGGNNNAYCQDNEIAWLDWAAADGALAAFVARLSAFRRAHPSLRQSRFLHGTARAGDGLADVEWLGFDGKPLNWRDPGLSELCLMLRTCADTPAQLASEDTVFIAINRSPDPAQVVLPAPPAGQCWRVGVDTSDTLADRAPCTGEVSIAGAAILALVPADAEPAA